MHSHVKVCQVNYLKMKIYYSCKRTQTHFLFDLNSTHVLTKLSEVERLKTDKNMPWSEDSRLRSNSILGRGRTRFHTPRPDGTPRATLSSLSLDEFSDLSRTTTSARS